MRNAGYYQPQAISSINSAYRRMAVGDSGFAIRTLVPFPVLLYADRVDV